MVLARPTRSPKTPNPKPPVAQPIKKMDVEIVPYKATSSGDADIPFAGANNSCMAGTRARLKSC